MPSIFPSLVLVDFQKPSRPSIIYHLSILHPQRPGTWYSMVDIFEKMLQIGSALAHHLGENRGDVGWTPFPARCLKRVGVPVAECKLRKMCLANDVKPVKLPVASNPSESNKTTWNWNHCCNFLVLVYQKKNYITGHCFLSHLVGKISLYHMYLPRPPKMSFPKHFPMQPTSHDFFSCTVILSVIYSPRKHKRLSPEDWWLEPRVSCKNMAPF